MKKHRNPILVGVISRVRQLLERYNESTTITHTTTKGSLREAYLKEFLADFVPHGLSISSGFITDNRGADISPQLDLLIFDPRCLPGFALSGFATIVPVEAARLVIEVKSRLEQKNFEQIKTQQDSFRKMRIGWGTLTRGSLVTTPCDGFPQFAIAFECACSLDSLAEWFIKEPQLQAVCVVNGFCMIRDQKTNAVEFVNTDEHFSDVMQLIALMHMRLSSESSEPHPLVRPDLGLYVAYDGPESDYEP